MKRELEEGGDMRNPETGSRWINSVQGESESATYTLFVTEVHSLKSLPGYTSNQGLGNPGNPMRCKNQVILTKRITKLLTLQFLR